MHLVHRERFLKYYFSSTVVVLFLVFGRYQYMDYELKSCIDYRVPHCDLYLWNSKVSVVDSALCTHI